MQDWNAIHEQVKGLTDRQKRLFDAELLDKTNGVFHPTKYRAAHLVDLTIEDWRDAIESVTK